MARVGLKFQYQDKEGLPIRETDMGPAQLAEMYFICKDHLLKCLMSIPKESLTKPQKEAIQWLKDHSGS